MSNLPSVIRIKPHFFIHVLDNNTNVTRVEIGPQTVTRQDHEQIVAGPDPMIMVPPRHYCLIGNPVKRVGGKPVLDKLNQATLRHGDEEIRFEQDPFPLHPGEKLLSKVAPLQVVAPNTALRLRAIRDIKDAVLNVVAGDEWLYEGPGTYLPRVEVQVVEVIRAVIVKPNQALKLRARKQCVDRAGAPRQAGEEWIVRSTGAYLPAVDEEVLETLSAFVLTEKKALHLRATKSFTDVLKRQRKAGEEWLVTFSDAATHIPDVYETVVGEVNITSLNNRQYCVVLDPVDPATHKQKLGQRELRTGDVTFFLQPGERLEAGIQSVHVLAQEESILLRAKEQFVDKESGGSVHVPGDRWMIYGPRDFVPSPCVEIVEKRRAIPLDENEGIYVRDIKSGQVRSVCGQSYMLKPNEELWEKDLPPIVEELLKKERRSHDDSGDSSVRDRTRVVTYRAPHNSAVQIYDYKAKKARIVFGPEQVLLGPDEQFSVLSLSGDKPKRPHVIKSLALLLGPDFMTDVVIVETSDHARLSLTLAYNWQFEVDKKNTANLFQVPDFVGDACKAIASRVRGAVASSTFDSFHKGSADIIRTAVFGLDEKGRVRSKFSFTANQLVITNIDIQSVEPVDQRTRDSLNKSVQMAIEITTKSQEASAKHEAERLEQEAKGRLERQRISDEAEAERARKELLQLQAQSAAVESTGQATAEAKARAEAAQIEGEAGVKMAKLKSESSTIRAEAELAQLKAQQEAEVEHARAVNQLELSKARALAEIESSKFRDVVDAIGADTICAIARAGPEMQARLLQGLGLKSFLITDGNSPINLFNTASGIIGQTPAGSGAF